MFYNQTKHACTIRALEEVRSVHHKETLRDKELSSKAKRVQESRRYKRVIA